MIVHRYDPDRGRSGYVLADALAGLGILAVGLAAFLGSLTQAHHLMHRAEQLRAWRTRTLLELSLPAEAGAVFARPLVTAHSAPDRFLDAGVGLCEVRVAGPGALARVKPPRTIRFCLQGQRAAR